MFKLCKYSHSLTTDHQGTYPFGAPTLIYIYSRLYLLIPGSHFHTFIVHCPFPWNSCFKICFECRVFISLFGVLYFRAVKLKFCRGKKNGHIASLSATFQLYLFIIWSTVFSSWNMLIQLECVCWTEVVLKVMTSVFQGIAAYPAPMMFDPASFTQKAGVGTISNSLKRYPNWYLIAC